MHQEVEPDQRTGPASKADRSTLWDGEHVLQLPPCTAFGPVAQQQERLALNQEGDGANPSGAANFHTPVAQCIEHRASNAEVAGESPAGSATPFPRRSPIAEALRSDRSQCRCNCGSRRYAISAPRWCDALTRTAFLPPGPFIACVAQQQRHRSQKPDSASANVASPLRGMRCAIRCALSRLAFSPQAPV